MAFGLWAPKSTSEKSAQVAKRFFDAIQGGDIATVSDLFAPEAKIWHNTDEIVGNSKATVRTLRAMHKFISNIKYEDRQLASWPGGFVEQHVLTGLRKVDGGKVRLPACIVCDVNAEGKITRLDEYFDSEAQNMFAKAPQKAKL